MIQSHTKSHKDICMSGNIKVTLSLPEATNMMAEKLKTEMNISKSEVFATAMKLLAREQRLARIKKAASNPEAISYYKNNAEVREWQELDRGYHETI